MKNEQSAAESLAQNYLEGKGAFPSVWSSDEIEKRWLEFESSMTESHCTAATTYLCFIIGAAHGCTTNIDMVRSATHFTDDIFSKYLSGQHTGVCRQSDLDAAILGFMRSFVINNPNRLPELINQYVQHFVSKWPKHVPYLNHMGVVECSFADPDDMVLDSLYLERLDGSIFFDASVVQDNSLALSHSEESADQEDDLDGDNLGSEAKSVWDLLEYEGSVLQWVDTWTLPDYHSETSFFHLWVQSQPSKKHSWLANPLEYARKSVASSLEKSGLVPLHAASDEDIQSLGYQSALREVQEECIFQIQQASGYLHHEYSLNIKLPHGYRLTKGSSAMDDFSNKNVGLYASVCKEVDQIVNPESCICDPKEIDAAKWCVALTCFMVMYLEIRVVQLSDTELREYESQL